MAELASHILCMTDTEIGAWLRKAVSDCINGCANDDADEFIKKQFLQTVEEQRHKQEHDARTYRNRLARQKNSGKPNHDKTNDTDAGAHSVRGTPDNAAPASNLLPIDNTKKLYGRFRHVRLSDEDGRELREEFGPRLKDAIEMLDNYIESLPSKKAGEKKCGVKYWQEDYERKNHKLCMLRWVKRAIDENEITVLNKKAAEARLKKAESTPKSFQQQDLDARTKFFFTSVVDKMLANEE